MKRTEKMMAGYRQAQANIDNDNILKFEQEIENNWKKGSFKADLATVKQWEDYTVPHKHFHIFKGITYTGKVVLPKDIWRDYEYDTTNKTIIKKTN